MSKHFWSQEPDAFEPEEETQTKYQLEKVIVIGEEGSSKRREEHIAYSENYYELIDMASKLPLKGGRYLSEWFAILELDENDEIVDHAYTMFAEDHHRKVKK